MNDQSRVLCRCHRLGKGAFAAVYETRLTPGVGGPDAAAKLTLLHGLSTWRRDRLSDEEKLWQALRHPHIVECYASSVTDDGRWHVLLIELSRGGELFDRVQTMGSFHEVEAARWVRQTLSAVEYLHELGVVHRDIKPENLLLDRIDADPRRQNIKLADFGEAKVITDTGTRTPCGSIGYGAPEQLIILRGQSAVAYGKAADMWAVGMLTHVLLSGTLPYDPRNYVVAMVTAAAAQEPVRLPEHRWGHVSWEARHLVQSLLQFRPQLRPQANEAKYHAWFAAVEQSQHATTPLSTPIQLGELRASGLLPSAWQFASRLSARALVSSAAPGVEPRISPHGSRRRAAAPKAAPTVAPTLGPAVEPTLEPESAHPLPLLAVAAGRLVERTGTDGMAEADSQADHTATASSSSSAVSSADSSMTSCDGDALTLSRELTRPARIPDEGRGGPDAGCASQPCTFRRRSSRSVLSGFDSLSGRSSMRAPATPSQRGIHKSKPRSAGLWLSPLVADRRVGSSNEII